MINKFSDVPLYIQLKNELIERINKGEYAEDTQIPSEQELCELYNISRPTVRQAVSELTNNGYLYKAKGKGTFVLKRKQCIDLKNYCGFTDSILDCLLPGGKNILEFKCVTNQELLQLNEAFGLKKETRMDFAEIKYLTSINNDVVSFNRSFIPLNVFPNIEDDLKTKRSSYEILKGKYPYIPVKSKSAMEVVFSENSDSEYLQIQPGQPLLKFENILFSKSGQAVEYIVSKFRSDRCRFAFENVK